MTVSETICSELSAKFFYDEFVFDNLKFDDGTEKEFADLLINMYDTIIVVQIKEREEDSTSNIQQWYNKKVNKKAVSQINDTLEYAKNIGSVVFTNRIGQEITIDFRNVIIVPIIVFASNDIMDIQYPRQRTSKKSGRNIDFFSVGDFITMCELMETPMEILDYLQYRVNSGNSSYIANEKELLRNYLSDRYSIDGVFISREYIEAFKHFISNFGNQRVTELENIKYIEIIRHLVRFNRVEIVCFIERFIRTREYAFNGQLECKHFMLSKADDLGYLFISTPFGNYNFVSDMVGLFKYKNELSEAIGINVYYENTENFRVDAYYISREWRYDERLHKDAEEMFGWIKPITLDRISGSVVD